MTFAQDKKLHYFVLLVLGFVLSFVWDLAATALAALVLYFLHQHITSLTMGQRVGITATVGEGANILKEAWDAGWMNWYPAWWPVPSWVPWISNKTPLTGWDNQDLMFGTAGLACGLVIYVMVVLFRSTFKK